MSTRVEGVNGVWRTIAGRRVFIKNGKSLSEAMRESGKFNHFSDKAIENKNNLRERKNGNDFLPKTTEIKSQGTSNRKDVSENIQAHILSYYDNPVDFMEQMDNMDYLPTKWHAGQELARGGSYAIYYDDQREFLDNLKINPKGKEFSDDKVFQTYTSLIGRESEHLYNKLDKLFQKYKMEHKNSNVTLDDFRNWFK